MLATPVAARRALITLGATYIIGSFLLLDLVGGVGYTLIVAVSGAAVALLALAVARRGALDVAWLRLRVDLADIVAVAILYVVVVAGFRLAFTVFATDTLALVIAFWAALLIGVIGPIYYTVWLRRRPLASLGLTRGKWRTTLILALLLGAVQFTITLARVDHPAAEIWLPLLAMALVVGFFEAIFFRGFIQNRLEAWFGAVPAVAVAASLYGLYHVGYGMGTDEMIFLIGLGVLYAVAFRLAGSILVLWPLLTPLGSFFSQLQAADLVLPLESILGFADVLAAMLAAVWLAHRHERPQPAALEAPVSGVG